MSAVFRCRMADGRGAVLKASPDRPRLAFEAVDLLLWQPDDLETVEVRTERLAAATGLDPERLFGRCVAFAAMTAPELASQGNRPRAAIEAPLELASQA